MAGILVRAWGLREQQDERNGLLSGEPDDRDADAGDEARRLRFLRVAPSGNGDPAGERDEHRKGRVPGVQQLDDAETARQ